MLDPYWRRATVRRIVDGDTIDFDVDLGFYLRAALRVRLLGVDTPELRSRNEAEKVRARHAATYVEEWFVEHGDLCFIRTEKGDAFGRWLAEVVCHDGHYLNHDLIVEGHAEPWQK